jgi:hypothetical protein
VTQISLCMAPGQYGTPEQSVLPTSEFGTHARLLAVLGVPGFFLVAQLATGTDTVVSFLFAAAILFGVMAIFAGGGFSSAFGCLNAILIAKFLIFGLAVKILLAEPADGPLRSPLTTGWVMALGFLGLFLGTKLQSHFHCPQSWAMNPIGDEMLLSFSIVIVVISYFSYFISMVPQTQGEGLQTGGWVGIAKAFSALKSFAIVPPMLYLWKQKTRLWMTHPVILTLFTWSVIVGIFSTSKEDALAPLACYVLVGFLRYGVRDMRLWTLGFVILSYYAFIIYPYSQYVRFVGGRAGTFTQRAEITKDVFFRIATDSNFRTATSEKVAGVAYFEEPQLSPFSRLAMVGEADRLIDATARQQAFTGWETIVWGFKMLPPSFLVPDKPVFQAGNRLAHIAGDVGSADTTTQVSYGVMANFYNAFGLPGVFIGTALFFAGFYYWVRVFLGEVRWSGAPDISALWFIWLIASFQHSIVESAVSGLIASLSYPFVLLTVWAASKWVSRLVPARVVS